MVPSYLLLTFKITRQILKYLLPLKWEKILHCRKLKYGNNLSLIPLIKDRYIHWETCILWEIQISSFMQLTVISMINSSMQILFICLFLFIWINFFFCKESTKCKSSFWQWESAVTYTCNKIQILYLR